MVGPLPMENWLHGWQKEEVLPICLHRQWVVQSDITLYPYWFPVTESSEVMAVLQDMQEEWKENAGYWKGKGWIPPYFSCLEEEQKFFLFLQGKTRLYPLSFCMGCVTISSTIRKRVVRGEKSDYETAVE